MFPVLRPSPRPSPGLGPSPRRGDTTPPFLHLRDLQLSCDSLAGLDWTAGGGSGAAAFSPHQHHHHKVPSEEVSSHPELRSRPTTEFPKHIHVFPHSSVILSWFIVLLPLKQQRAL